jgi:hypothetical protein
MRILLSLLACAALLLGPAGSAAQSDPMYESMRRIALTTRPADVGVTAQDTQPVVYGIVMDMDISGRTATLVSFSTGDTSLYLSSGGGSIGGIGHANVAAASRDFVAAARPHLAAMAATRRHPRPGRGQTIFYLLTTAGVHSATRSTAALEAQTDALSPLFAGGQRVLTLFLQAAPP